MGIIERIEKEWPMLRAAPYSFAVLCITSLISGIMLMYLLYNIFILPGKDAQISMLQQKIIFIQDDIKQNTIDSNNMHMNSIEPNIFDSNTIEIIKTKEEIRNFFKAINPAILRRIDSGQGYVLIRMDWWAERRLNALSEKPNFNIYLSFRTTGGRRNADTDKHIPDSISQLDYCPPLVEYFLIVHETLIK